MYTIKSPHGKHGALGRKIQRELENERTERCLNAKYRQLVVQDIITNVGSNPDEHCASNETGSIIVESPEHADIKKETHSK